MAERFTPAEFLASGGPERAKQCRKLANAAHLLAADASSLRLRAGYLELKQYWNTLAEEIERDEESPSAPNGVLPDSTALKPG